MRKTRKTRKTKKLRLCRQRLYLVEKILSKVENPCQRSKSLAKVEFKPHIVFLKDALPKAESSCIWWSSFCQRSKTLVQRSKSLAKVEFKRTPALRASVSGLRPHIVVSKFLKTLRLRSKSSCRKLKTLVKDRKLLSHK